MENQEMVLNAEEKLKEISDILQEVRSSLDKALLMAMDVGSFFDDYKNLGYVKIYADNARIKNEIAEDEIYKIRKSVFDITTIVDGK